MPLIYYRSVKGAEVGMWNATESTEFFKERLLNQHFPMHPVGKISHPEKIHQWYASRYLLCEIYPEAIQIYRDQKPFLLNGPELSFSHSQKHVAVIISNFKSGIDVQWTDPKLKIIAPRFLNETDLKVIKTSSENISLSIIWAIKEAVFKKFGTEMPFKEIKIDKYDPVSDIAWATTVRKGEKLTHKLVVDHIDGMSLAYIVE